MEQGRGKAMRVRILRLTAPSHGVAVSWSNFCDASSFTTAGGIEGDTACAEVWHCSAETHKTNKSHWRDESVRSMLHLLCCSQKPNFMTENGA